MTDIYIARAVLEENKEAGENKPPIIVQQDGQNKYAHDVFIKGPAWVTHRPNSPHPSGAVVWITTDSEVEIVR